MRKKAQSALEARVHALLLKTCFLLRRGNAWALLFEVRKAGYRVVRHSSTNWQIEGCRSVRCASLLQRGNSVGHEFSARCDTAHLFSVVLGLSNLESPTTSKKKKRANIFRFCLRSIRLAEDRQVKALYLFILHIWYCFYSSTSSLSLSHLFLFFSRFLQSVPIPLLAYCNNLDAHVALSLFFFFISRVTRTLSACVYQSAAFILVCFSSCSFMLLSRQLARFFFLVSRAQRQN